MSATSIGRTKSMISVGIAKFNTGLPKRQNPEPRRRRAEESDFGRIFKEECKKLDEKEEDHGDIKDTK